MRELYLVRHTTPQVQPDVPAPRWQLSPRGVEEARALAATAASWGLAALYSSIEPKAQATALILGDVSGIPVRVVEGFEELRLDDWIGNADRFNEVVRAVLADPDVAERGAERASAAAARFAAAIEIVEQGPFPAAVVSHGRILTSYLATITPTEDPYALWRSIPMPGWARLDLDAPSAIVFRS